MKQKNITIATELKDKLARAKAVILTDYRGLTHKQSEDFHRAVRTVDAEYVIVKNSLLARASSTTSYELRANDLTGPTAALIAYGDEILPLKELAKFMKATTLPKIKFGFIGQTRYEGTDIDRFAKLPSKSELQGQVVSRLSSPLYGLAYSLNYNLAKFVYVIGQIKKS